MRKLDGVVDKIAEIYRRSGKEAEEYLRKARKLKERLGPSFAIVYCWFYSVPQKWIQVEPKIFELDKRTKSFEIDKILSMSSGDMAEILRPMIFRNEISHQLKNFCEAVKNEYGSWEEFAKTLESESIFKLFCELRKHRNIRITFKNLAAMKIFVGMNDDLIILDTHVANVLGISKNERSKCIIQKASFQRLLEFSRKITDKLRLRKEVMDDISMVKWSLSIWFSQTKISADKLIKGC